LSNNGVAICMSVMMSGRNFPFFLAGASASDESFVEAAEKSLQEVETLYIGSLYEKDSPKILIEDVRGPADHGRVYYDDCYRDEIEWLWQGKITRKLPEIDHKHLIDKYEHMVVQLSKDEEYLQVVRVLCPSLVPMTFGYRNECYTHPSIRDTGYVPGNPHFFA